MPSFPSETFPNHWTLITGLYPINHGIVSDTFYDEEADIYFNASDPNTYTNREVWGGEPIWTTLKKQNISTAVNMWPGADANWGEDGPDEVTGFDKDQPLEEKTAQIIEWLDREEPPQLMMAYLPNVDTAGRNTQLVSLSHSAHLWEESCLPLRLSRHLRTSFGNALSVLCLQLSP